MQLGVVVATEIVDVVKNRENPPGQTILWDIVPWSVVVVSDPASFTCQENKAFFEKWSFDHICMTHQYTI